MLKAMHPNNLKQTWNAYHSWNLKYFPTWYKLIKSYNGIDSHHRGKKISIEYSTDRKATEIILT